MWFWGGGISGDGLAHRRYLANRLLCRTVSLMYRCAAHERKRSQPDTHSPEYTSHFSHAHLDFASLHLGRGLRPIPVDTTSLAYVRARRTDVISTGAWLIANAEKPRNFMDFPIDFFSRLCYTIILDIEVK